MNEANAHFDKLDKENQGFNVGRHQGGGRPTSAILAWRPRIPFLTYEKPTLTHVQEHIHTNKRLHAKVMDDRVQIYNQQFVPNDLLPSDCGWKKESKDRKAKKRSSSLDYPPMPKNQHCIAHDHSKDQKFKANIQKTEVLADFNIASAPEKETNDIQTEEEIIEKVLGEKETEDQE